MNPSVPGDQYYQQSQYHQQVAAYPQAGQYGAYPQQPAVVPAAPVYPPAAVAPAAPVAPPVAVAPAAQQQFQPPRPPATYEVKDKIDKLVTYLLRNGAEFERMIQEKQQNNPDFAFLFGGPDHEYYRWRLWCMQNGSSEDMLQQQLDTYHPNATAPPPVTPLPPGSATSMPAELEMELAQIFSTVNGSKESIKTARKWIMSHANQHQARIAECMGLKMSALCRQPFQTRLHLLYLLNDVLVNFQKKREQPDTVDPFADALGPHLLAVFSLCYPEESPEDKDKVTKLLQLWGQRKIYPPSTISDLETQLKIKAAAAVAAKVSAPLPNVAPPPPVAPAAAPAANYPVAAAPAQPFAGAPPPPAPAPIGAPPTSTMHLGPGFIVTLCKALPPYTPLDPLTVPMRMPPMYDKGPDTFLNRQLDQFYADLQRDIKAEQRRGKKW
eukprot:CAMPEP_0175173384 /NCGR_PEP_ID=MMETSP0087-20121206/32016_1 /TAXON_ID=136419 /ORGANISM="Unknown Unknown, Strain D1" /LENGTH=438 /DNA_ID=CAMNT_0016464675 /DNA_START=8 /DNA_END=1321 /DNA_ORIENTATION=-